MDAAMLLVGLLVVGVPAAVFLTLRRRGGPQVPGRRPEQRHAAPPGDFGMARESREPAQGRETSEASDGAAAAAAAGGALILAAGMARGHAADPSGDAPQADGDGGGADAEGEGR